MVRAVDTCSHRDCTWCVARHGTRPLLAARHEVPVGCPNALDSHDAERQAGRLAYEGLPASPAAAARLAALLGGNRPGPVRGLLAGGELVLCVARFRDRLRVSGVVRGRPIEQEEALAPVEAPVVTTWIQIQLVDEDCEPISGERYEIHCPDGTVRRGRTNLYGRARFDDIEQPGDCQIKFPDLDLEAWHGDVVCPEKEPLATPTFVAFELVDMEGQPVPGEAYRVTLPNGEVIEGVLDADGRVRLGLVLPGDCQFTFPNLDSEAWEAAENADSAHG